MKVSFMLALVKDSKFAKVPFLGALLLLVGVVSARSQVTIWSDNFEGYSAGQNVLAPWSSTGSLANYSATIASGLGVGGSQALNWTANFTGAYSGWMQVQLGYSGGNPSGNTDPNLGDYVLSFDMAVNGPTAVNHMQLNIQGWSGQNYSGTATSTGAQGINTSFIAPGSGFQVVSVNLGTLYGNSTGFDPTSQTYQFQWQLNGWELANGGPDSGVSVTIDNASITAVPEPCSVGLVGLGLVAACLVRRKHQ